MTDAHLGPQVAASAPPAPLLQDLQQLLDHARVAQAHLEDSARFARASGHDKASATLRDSAARLGALADDVRRWLP